MHGQSWTAAAASFLGMWVVMMAAMMLPSLVPMLSRYRRSVGVARGVRPGRLARLTAVVATQLWHHQFMGGGLADMPEWSGYQKIPVNDLALSR